MNDEDIEKLAQKVAEALYDLSISSAGYTKENLYEDKEQILLAELARLMTLLSSYLEREEYDKCAILQDKIKIIENKINKL